MAAEHGGEREGAGRKTIEVKKACQVNFYIGEHHKKILDRLARKWGLGDRKGSGRSAALRKILDEYEYR